MVGEFSVLGQIRQFLVQEIETTPLQQKLETIARDVAKCGLVAAVLVLIILLVRFCIDRATSSTWGVSSKYVDLIRYVIIAITTVVVSIPEGLPLSVTLSLAYSMKSMLADKNLVRRLQATETMGGANNICSDKTGTLTQNKMNLTNLWNGKLIEINPYEKGKLSDVAPAKFHDLIRQAIGCNSSATLVHPNESKTKIALLEFLENQGEDYQALRSQYFKPDSIKYPFSSQRKRMSVVLDDVENGLASKKRMHIKGNILIYDLEKD